MTRLDRYGEPLPLDGVDQVPEATTDHDPTCRGGWIGSLAGDDPIPCPVCKPWLAPCPTCGTSKKRCEFDRGVLRTSCCPSCPHNPPVTKTRRKRAKTPEANR